MQDAEAEPSCQFSSTAASGLLSLDDALLSRVIEQLGPKSRRAHAALRGTCKRLRWLVNGLVSSVQVVLTALVPETAEGQPASSSTVASSSASQWSHDDLLPLPDVGFVNITRLHIVAHADDMQQHHWMPALQLLLRELVPQIEEAHVQAHSYAAPFHHFSPLSAFLSSLPSLRHVTWHQPDMDSLLHASFVPYLPRHLTSCHFAIPPAMAAAVLGSAQWQQLTDLRALQLPTITTSALANTASLPPRLTSLATLTCAPLEDQGGTEALVSLLQTHLPRLSHLSLHIPRSYTPLHAMSPVPPSGALELHSMLAGIEQLELQLWLEEGCGWLGGLANLTGLVLEGDTLGDHWLPRETHEEAEEGPPAQLVQVLQSILFLPNLRHLALDLVAVPSQAEPFSPLQGSSPLATTLALALQGLQELQDPSTIAPALEELSLYVFPPLGLDMDFMPTLAGLGHLPPRIRVHLTLQHDEVGVEAVLRNMGVDVRQRRLAMGLALQGLLTSGLASRLTTLSINLSHPMQVSALPPSLHHWAHHLAATTSTDLSLSLNICPPTHHDPWAAPHWTAACLILQRYPRVAVSYTLSSPSRPAAAGSSAAGSSSASSSASASGSSGLSSGSESEPTWGLSIGEWVEGLLHVGGLVRVDLKVKNPGPKARHKLTRQLGALARLALLPGLQQVTVDLREVPQSQQHPQQLVALMTALRELSRAGIRAMISTDLD